MLGFSWENRQAKTCLCSAGKTDKLKHACVQLGKTDKLKHACVQLGKTDKLKQKHAWVQVGKTDKLNKTCSSSAGKNRQAKKNMLGFRWEKQTS